MAMNYRCQNERRRKQVLKDVVRNLNGIDYLEVDSGQRSLKVYFLRSLPSLPITALKKENIIIEGGVRIKDIKVDSVNSINNILTVNVSKSGDFSIYTLRLIDPSVQCRPPYGFDPMLSEISFSFKEECTSDFDCKSDIHCQQERVAEPYIDYQAKDYASLRQLMLDRLNMLMPDWKERNPADMMVALVEILAYFGDHLSYYQDAVATEAYLGKARKRISVRRHARLLDYPMHDGCNARAWVQVTLDEADSSPESLTLKKGTQFMTRLEGFDKVIDPDSEVYGQALLQEPEVFESMHEAHLFKQHNRLHFYTWGDQECCLPRGSTHATLKGSYPKLQKDDVIIFEEVLSPTTGRDDDADPNHRWAVKLTGAITKAGDKPLTDPLNDQALTEIQWDSADALPFPLCLSSKTDIKHKQQYIENVSIAQGNVILVDHGRSISQEELPIVGDDIRYNPVLKLQPVTRQGSAKEKKKQNYARIPFDQQAPATDAFQWDMRYVLPAIWLQTGGEEATWNPQHDLIGSSRFSREFVLESDEDGKSRLHFGDGILGLKPSPGSRLFANYRVGNGKQGNVGRESISHIVDKISGIKSICNIRNPMAARGGEDPEDMEIVRRSAPEAFRIQERAVTESDYAEVAERDSRIQKAVATIRWTGSWHTVYISIDRKDGLPVDEKFKQEMLDYLNQYRMAGYDLEIAEPIHVPLDIAMRVCVKPGFFRSDVKRYLMETFSRFDLPRGRGFFHPDNLTFGEKIYLSQIYQAAMRVPGVASLEVIRFQRWGRAPNKEKENGVLEMARLEIPRLDNDPNFPENGRLDIFLEGGL
ncbi:MAG: Baseplate J-like protein [Methanosaeta sp. PtaU1.Bin112]|jgi:hypothetical protein|nr:MAG: Baseplate J-like protein [Methanosaeta sp. PtaU1.Bin112]